MEAHQCQQGWCEGWQRVMVDDHRPRLLLGAEAAPGARAAPGKHNTWLLPRAEGHCPDLHRLQLAGDGPVAEQLFPVVVRLLVSSPTRTEEHPSPINGQARMSPLRPAHSQPTDPPIRAGVFARCQKLCLCGRGHRQHGPAAAKVRLDQGRALSCPARACAADPRPGRRHLQP